MTNIDSIVKYGKKCYRIGERSILKQNHEMNKNALQEKWKGEAKRKSALRSKCDVWKAGKIEGGRKARQQKPEWARQQKPEAIA